MGDLADDVFDGMIMREANEDYCEVHDVWFDGRFGCPVCENGSSLFLGEFEEK
jgi:hypothetical protein